MTAKRPQFEAIPLNSASLQSPVELGEYPGVTGSAWVFNPTAFLADGLACACDIGVERYRLVEGFGLDYLSYTVVRWLPVLVDEGACKIVIEYLKF